MARVVGRLTALFDVAVDAVPEIKPEGIIVAIPVNQTIEVLSLIALE